MCVYAYQLGGTLDGVCEFLGVTRLEDVHNDDLKRGDARRQHQALVISVNHDHDANLQSRAHNHSM